MLLGATNAFTGEIGKCKNLLTGTAAVDFSKAAREYKAAGKGWVIFGDENYGEGSSREHAAMCPRHLGCTAVIVRSFARIHETNLKKQGVLALQFANPADYDKIHEDDKVSLNDLQSLAPGKTVKMTLEHKDGSKENVELKHTYNGEQLKWFRAGSALNLIRNL
jgi:aconitate hydratase